ncbi:MAG: hypothetical protein ACIARR_01735 [Phycisphaerales bacterium JB059]
MTRNGLDILSLLGSGIRPVDTGTTRSPNPTSGADFANMLSQAQRGDLRTGLDVAISPALDLSLTPEQKAALSAAADQAESAGATQSLVVFDRMALVLDVTARQVVDIADLSQPGVLAGIDSVIRAGDTSPDDAPATTPLHPPQQVGNASLLDALARIGQQRSGAA